MTDSAKQDAAAQPAAKATPAAAADTAGGTAAAAQPGDPETRDPETRDPETRDPGTGDARPDEEATPALDDVKARFREALDRKRQVHADGQGKGGHEAGKVNGAHGPAASRRSFRRKSG